MPGQAPRGVAGVLPALVTLHALRRLEADMGALLTEELLTLEAARAIPTEIRFDPSMLSGLTVQYSQGNLFLFVFLPVAYVSLRNLVIQVKGVSHCGAGAWTQAGTLGVGGA